MDTLLDLVVAVAGFCAAAYFLANLLKAAARFGEAYGALKEDLEEHEQRLLALESAVKALSSDLINRSLREKKATRDLIAIKQRLGIRTQLNSENDEAQ